MLCFLRKHLKRLLIEKNVIFFTEQLKQGTAQLCSLHDSSYVILSPISIKASTIYSWNTRQDLLKRSLSFKNSILKKIKYFQIKHFIENYK